MDPNENNDNANAGTDGAAAAAQEQQPKTPDQVEQAAAAAFQRGVQEAKDGAPAPSNDNDDDDASRINPDGTDDGELDPDDADGAAAAADAAGKGNKPAGAGDKPAKPGAGKDGKPDGGEHEPEPDKEIEDEIAKRGLKEDTAKRFRQLAGDAKAIAPVRAVLEEVGISTADDVRYLVDRAHHGMKMQEAFDSTQCTPEQFGAVLGYLYAINSKDPVLMNQAFENMAKEQQWLAKELGRPAEGYDPLDADPELKERVRLGQIERADALEKIATKRRLEMDNERRSREENDNRQSASVQQGADDVRRLALELRQADPDNFQAKIAFLGPSIKLIQDTVPPGEWSDRIKALYKQTPNIAPVPKPKSKDENRGNGAQPIRPTTTNGSNTKNKPRDDLDAFQRGVREAQDMGY